MDQVEIMLLDDAIERGLIRVMMTATAMSPHTLVIGRREEMLVELRDLSSRLNLVSFADVSRLCKKEKQRDPGPRPHIAPVLGPPPSTPRNCGMDIRRLYPRRT